MGWRLSQRFGNYWTIGVNVRLAFDDRCPFVDGVLAEILSFCGPYEVRLHSFEWHMGEPIWEYHGSYYRTREEAMLEGILRCSSEYNLTTLESMNAQPAITKAEREFVQLLLKWRREGLSESICPLGLCETHECYCSLRPYLQSLHPDELEEVKGCVENAMPKFWMHMVSTFAYPDPIHPSPAISMPSKG